jgi:regulator of sigma E protease
VPDLISSAFDPLGALMVVLGLGALIFFHELGHFLACRATNTRVETFSIGFGPKLFGWRRGKTLYKIGLIPLGGYVKMAAENPGEPGTGAPDELPSKSFSQRLLIFTAGVIFNVLLGFLLFGLAFRLGVPFPAPRVGGVEHGAPAWEAGLRPGDLITHVGGREVLGFHDLNVEVAYGGTDATTTVTVLRDGTKLVLPIRPAYSPDLGFPRIGITPAVSPEAAGVDPDSPVGRAGGRKGDVIVAVDGEPVGEPSAAISRIVARVRAAPPDAKEVLVTLRVRRAQGGVQEDLRAVFPVARVPRIGVRPHESPVVRAVAPGERPLPVRPGDQILAVNGAPVEDMARFRETAAADEPLREIRVRRGGAEHALTPEAPLTAGEFAERIAGERDATGTVVTVLPDTPAARAGLRTGDRVLAVGGERVEDWTEMTEATRRHRSGPLPLVVARAGGGEETLLVEPALTPEIDGEGIGYEFVPESVRHQERNVFHAMAVGWRRTTLSMQQVALAIRRLLTREISARVVGGPITIATESYATWTVGLSSFLYILAIISINLAILNILPIPVLDGGQVVLLVAEKIRGRPLPERVIGAFQMVGLALILCLVALAFTNDITRLLR